MNRNIFLAVLTVLFSTYYVNAQNLPTSVIDITSLGAVADGKTLSTEAIQSAVDKCSEMGGTVLIPAGTFLTGSIELNNNVDIYLQQGALVLGSTNIDDYKSFIPELKSYNDLFLEYSIFYAEKKENISIRGEGTIDGQGWAFQATTLKKPDRYKNRPYVIRFVQCKNIRIIDVTLQNSAMWMQQYLACEDLIIRGIRVYNHVNKNNDMIDIDGCKNVIISDCIGDTDDDALTLKSTSPYITENVTITNCVISSHCNAIKFGTESTGGFRNITISNIVIKPSSSETKIYGFDEGISGITLATVDGGIIEGILINNIRIDGPQVPIYLRLGNRARKHTEVAPTPGVGIFKDVMISNVIATNIKSTGSSITGIPGHNIENVVLENISIEYSGGGTLEDADKIIRELEDHYPESTKWGLLPSYGFYVKHVENISLNNIEVKYRETEQRPAFIFENVVGLRMSLIKAECDQNTKSIIKFNNVVDAAIFNSMAASPVENFLIVEGEASNNIRLIGNDFSNVNESVLNKANAEIKLNGNIR